MAENWEQYAEKPIDNWEQYAETTTAPEKTVKADKTVGGFIKNAAGDVVDIGKGLYQIVRHPLNTASAIGDLAVGGSAAAQKEMGLFDRSIPFKGESAARRLAAPFVKAANDPAGIAGQMLDYAYEKPVSAAMNLSTGLGLAGKVADVGGAARLAGVLAKGSEYVNPATLASIGVQKGIAKIADSSSPALIESAMKIPPSVPKDIRDATVKTMREEKIPLSEKGLAKNRAGIDSLNDEVKRIIDTGSQSGQTVNMDSVVSRIDSLKDFYKDYPRAKKYLDELDAIKADVLAQNPADVTLSTAQTMKQRIYQINRKHYGDMKSVETEADKAIARGLKEEIVNQHPELKELNARESAMLNLDEFLERAVNRIGNYNIIRLGDTVLAAGGLAAGGPHGAMIAGVLAHIVDMPAFKVFLAHVLDAAKKIPKNHTVASNAAFQAQQIIGTGR